MYFLFYHVKLDTNNFADFFLDMENSFSSSNNHEFNSTLQEMKLGMVDLFHDPENNHFASSCRTNI